MTVRAGFDAVRRRIGEACARVGRDPAGVTLIAVSKTFPIEVVREAAATGHRAFGENRVQEAVDKVAAMPELEWHFIGHIQRRKARQVVGNFSLIHTVDGEPLAAELEKRAAGADVRQAVLAQVNLADEEAKTGAAVAEFPTLIDRIEACAHLDLRGLMAIPPQVDEPEQARVWFRKLRELRDGEADRLGHELPELSMGMTGDYEVAIEEGATLVRVGRAIFGERG